MRGGLGAEPAGLHEVQRDPLGSGQPPKVTLTDANGDTLLDEDGKPVTAPLYSPPTQGIYAHVVTDPATGAVSVQMVDAGGNLVPTRRATGAEGSIGVGPAAQGDVDRR